MVKMHLNALFVFGTADHVAADGLEIGGYNIDALFNADRFARAATLIGIYMR